MAPKSSLIAADVDQWVTCAGSVQMQAQPLPTVHNAVNESKEEGTACHALAKEILQSYQGSGGILLESDVIDALSENGVLITRELYDAAHEYVLDVLNYCQDNGGLQQIHLESRVSLEHIYPNMFGFPDCWAYNKDSHKLTVWEAKFGRTIVEAFECLQLTEYVVGIIKEMGMTSAKILTLKIDLRIVQPRGWHIDGTVRNWEPSYIELRPLIDRIGVKAHESMGLEPTCVVSEHCRNCDARHCCATIGRNTAMTTDYIGGVMPVNLSGANLGYELSVLQKAQKVLKARVSGLEAQALAEIKAGGIVPGFDYEQGQGRERWKKDTPVDEILMMAECLGFDPDELSDVKINCTPKQAITKGLDPETVRMYSETPNGAIKLVVDDGSKARQAFRK
jgi:hypothetical protein